MALYSSLQSGSTPRSVRAANATLAYFVRGIIAGGKSANHRRHIGRLKQSQTVYWLWYSLLVLVFTALRSLHCGCTQRSLWLAPSIHLSGIRSLGCVPSCGHSFCNAHCRNYVLIPRGERRALEVNRSQRKVTHCAGYAAVTTSKMYDECTALIATLYICYGHLDIETAAALPPCCHGG